MTTEIIIPYKPHKFQKEIHSQDKRFTLIVAHRRFGKTVAAVNRLIRSALTCSLPRPRTAYIAPYRHQSKAVAWDYLKHYSRAIPGIKINESELYVEYPNDSRVTLYGADNPDAIRWVYFDDVILDEVANMKAEMWAEVVRPSLSDRKGKALFIGTPKGINHFYELYQVGLKDDGWFVNLYDAVRTGIVDAEELALAKKAMSDNQFRQEFMCDFTASCDNTLITVDVVEAASKRSVHPSTIQRMPKIMGVDIARFGSAKSVIAKRQGHVLFPLVKLRNADTMDVAGAVAREINSFKADACFIDSGFNPGVISVLKGWGFRVTEVAFGGKATDDVHYANKRAEMWCNAAEWLTTGSIPDDLDLKTDLISPTYSYRPNGQKLLESKEHMRNERGLPSPDCGDATVLTFAHSAQANNFIGTDGKNFNPNYSTNRQVAPEWSPFDGDKAYA